MENEDTFAICIDSEIRIFISDHSTLLYTSFEYSFFFLFSYRNNLVELRPSLSRLLDIFASFQMLVYQTNVINPHLRTGKILNITRESNPEPLGMQSTTITTAPFTPPYF
jgi:hypothetical protein